MTGSDLVVTPPIGSGELAPADLADRLRDYSHRAAGAFSENTERAIKTDLRLFGAWCAAAGLPSLPASPSTVAGYIDACGETHKPATIRRRVASIAHVHKAAGLPDPTKTDDVRLALRRMAKVQGTRQRQAHPVTESDVAAILATSGTALQDLRDVALLLILRDLLGRRSEVVALQVDQLTFNEDGSATVLIARSKTDQAGEGAERWLSHRTVERLRRWLDAARIADGAILRGLRKGGGVGEGMHVETVNKRLKAMAKRAGLKHELISGHSGRVGMAQDLVAAGADLPALMQAGRWKTATMPARYAERLMAGRGAVARYYDRRGGHG